MRLQCGLFIYHLLLSITFAVALRLPRDGWNTDNRGYQGLALLPSSLSLRDDHTDLQVSHGERRGNYKRDDNDDDDLRVRNINILTTVMPVPFAAQYLGYFYNSLLYNALVPWSNVAPQFNLRMTMGPLDLTMRIVFDTNSPPRRIPWAFVRNFARNMLMMTQLGFTGTYVMLYKTSYATDNNICVEVRLNILWSNARIWE